MKRSAYTLVEVVLASAILAVVLLGAQSAVVIASRAIPKTGAGPGAAVAASGAMGTMADDLAAAMAFSTLTANAVEFRVPDRDGDSADDIIGYSWSGTPGGPLLRQVNGGTAATLIASVEDFTLVYDKVQVAMPTTYSEGAEITLFSYSPSSPSTGTVTSGKWWAQYFVPTLPAGARSWTVSRVAIVTMRNSGSSGQAKAQLRLDASGVPAPHVLGEFLMLESSMGSSFSGATATYSYVGGLTPGEGLWFVLQWVAGTEAFDLQYKTGAGIGAGAPLQTSANSGSSWSNVANGEMAIRVHGYASTPDPVQYQYVLTGVRCRLRTGPTAVGGVSQTWRILNQPVVPGP